MSPADARRQAVLAIGPVAAIAEDYRDEQRLPSLEHLLQDVRMALRRMTRAPGFTAAAVATLALGLGLNSAVLSLAYAIFLKPLPVDDAGDYSVRPVVQTPQAERAGVISPDGRWLAYAGLDSGTPQIFVRPFPNVDDARTQVSIAGGSEPRWARNGRELFYMALDGTVMKTVVSKGATWQSQSPMPVVDGRILGNVSVSLRTFDVSLDGQRFLMIKNTPGAESSASSPQIVVVQNWLQEWQRIRASLR